MNIATSIIERFAELSNAALNMFFLYRTLDTKIDRKKQILTGMIFLSARMGYYAAGFGFRPYFSVFAGLVYTYFVFAGRFRSHIIWTVIAVVIDGINDEAIISIYLLFPGTSVAQVNLPGTDRMIIIVIAKALLFLIYYFLTRRIDKSDNIQWQDCVLLLLIPVGCWTMLEIDFKYGDKLPVNMSRPLMSISSLVLLVIILSVVALYNRITINGKELAHSKLQLRMAEMTKEHISQINDIYAQLSTIRHDLHNHFSAIRGYINSKEYEALEQYVANLTNLDMNVSEFVKHPVLNALISTRTTLAKRENISFSANIELPEALPVTDVDLCILVSNILDNAFEANQQAIQPRFINLNTRVVNSYWVVACRNATKEKGNLRSSGSLKSTKRTTGVHGIGTKQIQKITEKTGGFVTYKHENYEFCTLAMLKLPEMQ